MPLTGIIPITGAQSIIPTTSWGLIGEDGKHYTVSGTQGVSTYAAKVGCCETESTVWTLTPAQWQSDFNGRSSGSPGAGGCAQGPIPVPGTPYFFVCGVAGEPNPPAEWSIGVRYKIESPDSIVADRIFAYGSNTTPSGLLGTCWCFGSAVIDGELFAVCWLNNGVFDGNAGTWLIRLPLDDVDIIEPSGTSWLERRTYVGAELGDTLGTPTYLGASIFFNSAAILKHPNSATSVMILTYRGASTLPGSGSDLTTPGSEKLIVDWSSQTVGSLQSAQADLGQPWADDGLGYAGVPTENNHYNGYSAPSVGSNGEVFFGRVFKDEPTIQGFRRFLYDESTGLFTAAGQYEFTITGAGEYDGDNAVIGVRNGSRLLMGRYDDANWRFGEGQFPVGRGGHTQIIGA